MKVKNLLQSVAIAGLLVHQASAFCATNNSAHLQTWYIFKDASGSNALKLLQGLQGTVIVMKGVNAGIEAGKSVAEAIASEGATAGKTAGDLLRIAQDNKILVTEAMDLSKLSKFPDTGASIKFDNSMLGKLGNLISMPSTGARWGKQIQPGARECWNKDSVEKQLKLDNNTSQIFYLVLEDTDDPALKKIALATALGVDADVQAAFELRPQIKKIVEDVKKKTDELILKHQAVIDNKIIEAKHSKESEPSKEIDKSKAIELKSPQSTTSDPSHTSITLVPATPSID